MKKERIEITLAEDYPVRAGSITIKKGAKLLVTPEVAAALEGFTGKKEKTK